MLALCRSVRPVADARFLLEMVAVHDSVRPFADDYPRFVFRLAHASLALFEADPAVILRVGYGRSDLLFGRAHGLTVMVPAPSGPWSQIDLISLAHCPVTSLGAA